eukprot:5263396-Ditylum_brightwellii.AAC.1
MSKSSLEPNQQPPQDIESLPAINECTIDSISTTPQSTFSGKATPNRYHLGSGMDRLKCTGEQSESVDTHNDLHEEVIGCNMHPEL